MKEILLSKGYVALIDDKDFDAVSQFNWTASVRSNTVYAYRKVTMNGKRTSQALHRFLMNPAPTEEVDHKDGDGLNNCRSNLRVCTTADNRRNARRRKDNTSGFKGVSCEARSNKWIAKINIDGKAARIGAFATPIEAANAYDAAAFKYHGQFAKTNAALVAAA